MARQEVKEDYSAIPETTALLKSAKEKGVRLEPSEELKAKPEFSEISRRNLGWWQPALATFARLSGWILAPLILGVVLGRWLDRRYDTEPWLFLATVMFAFFISMLGLVKNALEEFKKIEKINSNKDGRKQ